MTKAVIIEDELNGQELLQNLLQEYCKDIQIAGVADSVITGIDLIESTLPEIVFMDYQIEGGNGFDILDALPNQVFKVIFITGYSGYAIKAFKYAALDYILKPIDISELVAAVRKYNPNISNYSSSYKVFKNQLEEPSRVPKQIILPSDKEYRVINVGDILFIKAFQSYVEIYLTNGIKYISTEPLRHYENILPYTLFFKSHKSFILNLKAVKSVEQGRGGAITLYTEDKIPIATRRKTLFMKLLKNIQ